MEWPIPHTLALTAYGKAVLRGAVPATPALHGTEWVYQPLNFCRFIHARMAAHQFSVGAAAWYEELQTREARGMWFWMFDRGVPLPAPIASCWRRRPTYRCAIQVDFPKTTEIWIPTDDEMKAVECRHKQAEAVDSPFLPLVEAQRRLSTAFRTLARYAEEIGSGTWADYFDQAVLFAENSEDAEEVPRETLPADLLPGTGYSPDAHRLLGALEYAALQNGADSWENQWRDDGRFETVTNDLQVAASLSLMAVVNAG
jgi:hypothetical protein